MRTSAHVVWIVFVTCMLVLGIQDTAHAYLDPGTGGLLFQFLIAIVVGSMFFIKTIWRTFLGFFGIGRSSEEDTPDPTESAENND
jgi:hypothetical protein